MERVLNGEEAADVFRGYKIQSFLSISVRHLEKKLFKKLDNAEKEIEDLKIEISRLKLRGREL